MFWVPLSINKYQGGNSCRFYHTRPAILVTLTVMSSFLCTVIPKFFDELLSWLGKWTVLRQSCLFAAMVCSYGFRSECSRDHCPVWIGCNVEPKGPGGQPLLTWMGPVTMHHADFQGNAHERPQVCQVFQYTVSLSHSISCHAMRVPFHTREIYQPLMINDFKSTGLCNYININHNSTEGVICLSYE